MPFGIAAAGVAAAGSLAGAAMQSSATSGAAKAARGQQEMAFKIADAYNRPYREAGEGAVNQVNSLLGLSGQADQQAAYDQFRTYPGYQFALDQGLRAVDAGAAAKGMLRSGATLKAEETFGQGLASQQFGDYLNRLYSLSNIGQAAANQQAAAAQGTAGNMSNIALGEGAAQSSIYGNAAKGLGTAANDLLNNKGFQNWLGGSSGSIYGDFGSNVNYASNVAGPTVSSMFGMPNMSSFGY